MYLVVPLCVGVVVSLCVAGIPPALVTHAAGQRQRDGIVPSQGHRSNLQPDVTAAAVGSGGTGPSELLRAMRDEAQVAAACIAWLHLLTTF